MPWSTPTLRDVRGLVRDAIRASLPGSDATPANSVLRVLSDAMGALCHLTLQYVDWLALQLMPDTAETEWLDRHGQIWLTNADGTLGRKQATLASGTIAATGTQFFPVPSGSILTSNANLRYQTTEQVFLGAGPTEVSVIALDAGTVGNLLPGSALIFLAPPPNVDSGALVVELDGGTDPETDDQLRFRVLKRIREPPMGGDKTDYEQWALAVAGVTRAWCSPLEMGMGTVTLRFMCDDLRKTDNPMTSGFPTQTDINAVSAYLDQVRPVAVKDIFVVSPLPQRCDAHIFKLNLDTTSTRSGIVDSLDNMLFQMGAPGQTIYAAWKSYAIMNAPSVISFDLTNTADDVMESSGHLGVLGDIFYDQ